MPKFYPNQQIIDDKFAQWIYDELRDDKEISVSAIKSRKKFIEMIESFTLVAIFKDVFSSEQRVRDSASKIIEKIREKYNKEDYPEMWI